MQPPTAGDSEASDRGGAVVAIHGDLAIVVVRTDGIWDLTQGSFIVLRRTAGAWAVLQKIVVPDSQVGDRGYAACLDGETLGLGLANRAGARGVAWTYMWNGDYFGSALVTNDNHVLIGAPGDGGEDEFGNPDQGVAFAAAVAELTDSIFASNFE